ncbi:MAG TPA: myo-inosose-2 dehydratase [Casimicrobiaceae bacterium]|nr:myo-inosose-2 dehydratase [Casimicrobiaceae bacterium]
MSIKLGINPITWTNDDMPELGGDIPLEVCLAEAREAGYSGIELGGKFPREADVLAPILARHGLELVSGWYSAQLCRRGIDSEMAAVARHLDLLSTLGCSVMVFAEGHGSTDGNPDAPLSARPVLDDREWPAFAERLNAVAARLRDRGVRLAFHHHMGTVVQTEAEIDRLMAETTEEVALLLDTGHLVFAGGDPVAVACRHGGRIAHVHCKDVRVDVCHDAIRDDASFLRAVLDGIFTVPGDGAIDFSAVLRELRLHDYAGWLVVEAEQDPAKAHPLTYARMGRVNLKEAAESCGFAVTAAPASCSAVGRSIE